MRLKALLPLTLFLLLTTQTGFAQSKTESSPTSASEYGIDLKKSYTGSQVLAMIQIAEQEAEQSIDEAFDEGYKQGLLAGVPEAEYWKTKSMQVEEELSKANRQKWLFALGGFGGGLITGCGFRFTIRLQN